MQSSIGLFIGSSVGVSLGIPPWLAPSVILMGGLLFWIFPLGLSMPPSAIFLVWLVGLLVLYYVVHKLNPVRHDLLHLWRKFVACWIVLGKTLLCLIFSLILFLGCIPYGICSFPFLVLCIRRLLHVFPVMLYSLTYREWLFLSLVGLAVCSFNQIIQIYGCRLIGEEEFLIVWENVDLLLPAELICPTIEGGCLYLCYIFLIWSGFWRSEWISMSCFSVITSDVFSMCFLWCSILWPIVNDYSCPWWV